MSKRSPANRLLLYLTHAEDPHRTSVAPTLAAVAERAGWGFDLYVEARRAGRHFGGGNPDDAPAGWASGSLVAGGRHAEHAVRLATGFETAVLGDPAAQLWPLLEEAGCEPIVRSIDPAELFVAAFERLDQVVPELVLVLDASPQGARGVVSAPYLYPAFLAHGAALGVDVSASAEVRAGLERLGAQRFEGLAVESGRADAFPGGLEERVVVVGDDDYAAFTAGVAEEFAAWGRGVLLGDPELVAAQLPKARRLRLLPLYGRPQVDVLERAAPVVRVAAEPVFGRQYDDRDFLVLSELGHGLQVLDPDPPFDSAATLQPLLPEPPKPLVDTEQTDAELAAWADEGRVLSTLLFWCGMVREVHCLPQLVDLVAATGLRAGLVTTSEFLEHASPSSLGLLSTPVERGGVFGLVEPLLASTGRGVAFESALHAGVLRGMLAEGRAAAHRRLPAGLEPRGWWPLLDTPLVRTRRPAVAWEGRPVLRYKPASDNGVPDSGGSSATTGLTPRRLAGQAARASGLVRFLEPRRPFDDMRPGPTDRHVSEAVREAGFEYMWTKAAFGRPRVTVQDGAFVALTLTAGRWEGWSPFYAVGARRDLARAERQLRRGPGWLAGTIDTPLWLLPGEALERASTLFRLAERVARGGSSGRLVNVTPNVVARYARLLEERRR